MANRIVPRPVKPIDVRGRRSRSLEGSLIATVAPIMRHLLAQVRDRRSWQGLTYQQYNVLRLIDTTGPQAQATVAHRLMVTSPVVNRLASILVDAGLVERRTDPKDRRAVLLAATASGRRRVRAMRRELLEAAHELLEPIADERRAAVGLALEDLRDLLSPHSARH